MKGIKGFLPALSKVRVKPLFNGRATDAVTQFPMFISPTDELIPLFGSHGKHYFIEFKKEDFIIIFDISLVIRL